MKRIMYLQLAIWRTQTCLSSGYKRKSIGQANVNEILEQKAENTWNVLKEKSVWICKFNLPMYSSRTNNHRGNVFISVTKNRKKLYLFSTGKTENHINICILFLEISIITSNVLHIIPAAGFIFVSEAHFFLRYRTESNLHILFSPLARITILNGKIIPSVTSILQGRYSVL